MKEINSFVKRPEVLSPAGDKERLMAAVSFGADAVYLAGQAFGMRTSPNNFSEEEIVKAVDFAHKNSVKVYVTCNTLPHNEEVPKLPAFIQKLADAQVDAIIVADVGVLQLAKKYAPDVDLHISTQAGVVNYLTARAFYELGAKRVILARELTLEEIATIRAKTDRDLELEVFVHGSMCVSFSGRCLLSSYLTGRDANRGDCAQPCRWKYSLVEENREGQHFSIMEENNGAYILNSRDLCMINHIPEIINAGATSLKIEGRAKSAYYVATTTNAYRNAMDLYLSGKPIEPWIIEELEKISHREYSTGFFFGSEPGQIYSNGGYIRKYDVVAVCDGFKDGKIEVTQRNKFSKGDTLDVLEPGCRAFEAKVERIFDQWGNELDSAPHAMQKLTIMLDKGKKVLPGAYLRKKR